MKGNIFHWGNKIIIILLGSLFFSATPSNKQVLQTEITYRCIPCGYDCDKAVYKAPGTCSHCNMELVPEKNIRFKNIQANALCAYIKAHPNVLLLDVRTPEEFEQKADPNFGVLKNAVNIPVQILSDKWQELAAYKNKEIIVYCSHSHRSPRAAYLLGTKGFKKITNMDGGMSVLTDRSCVK